MEEKINDQNKLDNCTFVKTILMIFVVLYHSILFWGVAHGLKIYQ